MAYWYLVIRSFEKAIAGIGFKMVVVASIVIVGGTADRTKDFGKAFG